MSSRILQLEHGNNIVQARDKGRSIRLSATTCSVREADNIGATLPKPEVERQSPRVVRQGNKPLLAVRLITHQHGEFSTALEDMDAIGKSQPVAFQKGAQGWRSGQIAGIGGIEFHPPVRRLKRSEIVRCVSEWHGRVAEENSHTDLLYRAVPFSYKLVSDSEPDCYFHLREGIKRRYGPRNLRLVRLYCCGRGRRYMPAW